MKKFYVIRRLNPYTHQFRIRCCVCNKKKMCLHYNVGYENMDDMYLFFICGECIDDKVRIEVVYSLMLL